ncbi:PilZ domain-containing protein [Archangium primigenium]|uniref:PilZ domain-containing protein n=1 Tax=[Archangium] primigenium TaxID=2792470 RepID=UPI00195958B6|nr:PilZ domain-containing protein [Archangium primigenium]MBM7116749.1 PilZ domain-containing protein [Archangium primigenium]
MSNEHERRRFRRYPLRMRARVRHEAQEVDADVLNASLGGCLLVAHLNVSAGATIEVSIPQLQVPPTAMCVVRCAPTEGGFLIATCFEAPLADEPSLAQAAASPLPPRAN